MSPQLMIRVKRMISKITYQINKMIFSFRKNLMLKLMIYKISTTQLNKVTIPFYFKKAIRLTTLHIIKINKFTK